MLVANGGGSSIGASSIPLAGGASSSAMLTNCSDWTSRGLPSILMLISDALRSPTGRPSSVNARKSTKTMSPPPLGGV
jgi:hypothetical protein